VAYQHSVKLKPLSMAIAMLFTVAPVSLLAAEANDSKEVKEQSDKSTASVDSKDVATLSTVEVQSSKQVEADGYQATKTRVGKVLQDPHDIPQAITTVTQSLMQDQQVSSLRDALRNVSGLTFNAAEGGRGGDNFNLRGFYTFGDIYLDGLRDTAQYYRETFNLEQVDVLRGSAAMLFGRGQAGGVINQVTKMAELEDSNKVTGSLGNMDYHQMTGDFNKKLGETTAVRVNVMNRHEESYRENPATGDHPETDREGIALSIGTGIGTNNEFFLNHVYTQTRDVPDYGIGFVSRKPVDRTVATGKQDDETFYGNDRNFDDSDVRVTTGVFTHKFTEDTQLRTQLRSASYDRAYWAKTPQGTGSNAVPTNDSQLIGGNQARKLNYETLALQSDFSTKFDIAGKKNEFLAGVEYLKENSERFNLRNIGSATFTNYTQSATTGAPTKFKADNYALYLQDTIEFVKNWDLLFGIRRDELRADYSSLSSPKLSFGENSYRTGLSWHQTPESHYYVSYSDSFSPTADLYQLSGGELPPERSKTTEAGAKWLFMDGDLSFRTALYKTQKEWERNTDLESTAALNSQERHTNGLEFELAGKVTDDWEVFGGVAFMQAKIDKQYDGIALATFASTTNNGTAVGPTGVAGTGYATGEAADASKTVYRNRSQQVSEGERPRNTPTVTFNMWSTYKFAPGWKVGGGFEAKAERVGYGVGTCNTATQSTTAGATFGKWTYNNCSTTYAPNGVPGYVRVDAMLAYEQQKWAVRLNVKNLLDKVYYDSIYENGGFTVPGNRRQAIITTEYKF
jgi:catecholate siderophore receptor